MTEILTHCKDILDEEENKEELCLNCLTEGFYSKEHDTYNCLNKLCYYTLNYGPIYVSEIYHFLEQSQMLETNFLECEQPLTVMSLGCGFGPDYIAMNKYIEEKNLNMEYSYIGYDKEFLWKDVTHEHHPDIPIERDIINDGFDCTDVDILFMNKVFSTLKNHDCDDDFLDTLCDELSELKEGSFLIYNDINNWKMGREKFERFAKNNNLEIQGKYFFDVGNAFNDNYTKIEGINNICNIPDDLGVIPRDGPTKSVFFLFKKI